MGGPRGTRTGSFFGTGNGGSTVHTDGKGDGLTNPPSFCRSDGLSTGQICNANVSSYSDDDGGNIRIQAGVCYQNPVPIPG